MDVLWRSTRISRKERIRNVAIRQQIGLEETIIKEIEQNQLTRSGHIQGMPEGSLPKNKTELDDKTKESTRKTKKTGRKVKGRT
jgi:hypothetical protein